MWDITRGEKVGSLVGHENRVSCLGVSNDGISLCTGSWDSVVSAQNQNHHAEFVANCETAQNLGILNTEMATNGGDGDGGGNSEAREHPVWSTDDTGAPRLTFLRVVILH